MINPHEENVPNCSKHLNTFGEMGVVRSIVIVKYNLDDQVTTCIFLSYAQNHKGGTYHMLNIWTKFIVLSRDIIWLTKHTVSTYQEKKLPRQTVIYFKIKTIPMVGIT